MTETEMTSLEEMLMEHDRIENEISERFQALTRRSSVMEIRDRMRALITENANRVETLQENIDALEAEKETAERENQRLQQRLDEELEMRHRSEQDLKRTIQDLERKVQPLERKCSDLERELQEARQRAETAMEEIHGLRQEIEKEKIDRRITLVKLENDATAKERSLREAELENARLKEKIDKCERECENKGRNISLLREENANLKAEITKIDIKLASEGQKFKERISEMERQTLRWEQENRDLNDKLALAMRIIHDYIRKSVLTREEFSRIRARLDAVDREETMNREQLERDLRQFNTRY
ncbi:chromosome partition protein Smc-like [Mercenaria mercenaria]|uniref:chromosome partition protein Smc-like n=1 Tax=Mercenaria mercenaria TaxID=6596 RepID=UPI00234F622E|nr:chromosome partition protein Smc-like [Mercenaria mercenaria]